VLDRLAAWARFYGVPHDVEARAFGNRVIRDLIGTQAEHYYGWTLDIAEGERALPSIPFVPAN
jgi:hypothetical protein